MNLTDTAKQMLNSNRHALVFSTERYGVGVSLFIDGVRIKITNAKEIPNNLGNFWRYTVVKHEESATWNF